MRLWQECWCPGSLRHCSVLALGWAGRAMHRGRDMGTERGGTLFSALAGLAGGTVRSVCPMGPHWCQSADLGSACGRGSTPAWLAGPQTCCGLRPAQLLSRQPCVMGDPKTLLGGEIRRGKSPPRYMHTGTAQGKGCRGDWPESTRERRGEEETAAAPLLLQSQVRSGQSRIQARGPAFVQAASQSRAGRRHHRGGQPVSSQPLKRAGAAHAGVGQGSRAAKQALVGHCRLRAGRDEGCLVGVSRQKGVQEKN